MYQRFEITEDKWGADYLTLRRLYISLILPKLDYASPLFETASNSNLLVLERVQYAAARVILGAIKCTPVEKLNAEVYLMPLTYRRKMLLAQYGYRILSIPDHPIRNLLNGLEAFELHLNTNYELSAVTRLKRELGILSVNINSVPVIQRHLRYRFSLLPVKDTLTTHRKSELTPTEWKEKFHELLLTQECRIEISLMVQ